MAVRNKLSAAIALALLSPLAGTALAENADTAESNELLSMTVTAGRVEERNLDVPASIGTVSEKDVALDNPDYQKELLNSIAGVNVTQTGSVIGHKTAIRMPLGTDPYYLFLQDGIPVQSSGFFNHNGLAYTNYSGARSAEVLKGAGTALYGSDSIAGTINILSNDPSLMDGYRINLDAGSDGFGKVGVAGGVESGDHSIGFSASHSVSDGWREHTNSKRSELNLTHFVNLNENNSLKTVFAANRTQAEQAGNIRDYDEFKSNPESVGDIAKYLLDEDAPEIERKFDFTRLSTEWTHSLNAETELSTIAYVRANRNRYTASWLVNLPQNDSKQKSAGLMFKANVDKGTTRWTLGTDIEYTKAEDKYLQPFEFFPTKSFHPAHVAEGTIYDYDVDYKAISPYFRIAHDLTEQLTLAGGLRYDASSYDYTNNVDDGQYDDSDYRRAPSDLDPSFNHLSPKLSALYRLDDNQNVYARYANGFRIPQASRLYRLTMEDIDFTLDPEVSDTFEVGYKWADGRNLFEVSAYHMVIDDTIVGRESNGFTYYENGGKTTHDGIELTAQRAITDEFTARLAYSYSEHKFDNDEEFGDNEQASAPNHLANMRLYYDPKAVPGLNTMLEVVHVGDYWMDDNNTHTYDGYTIGNLKTTYQVDKDMKVSARINNITDRIYAEEASYAYGSERYTPGGPRQFFVGLEIDL